jgi:MarR family transcriptional regulator, organic hydroperoxide resistance regulator
MTRTSATTKPRASAPSAGAPATPLDDLRASLYQLLAAERRLRSRDHSRPGELTHAQLRTIMALGREGELSAGQLAKYAELTPGTVTALLDQLEEADIVERRRSTEDRRVCNVALTGKGSELRERKLAAWQSMWDERLSRFSDEELRTAGEIMHEMTGIFDLIAGKATPEAAESE